MANWNQPALTDGYSDFLDRLKQRDEDLARMFDVGSPTNVPTDAVRWNSTTRRWEKWSGAAWAELESDYDISTDRLGGIAAATYARQDQTNTFTNKQVINGFGSSNDGLLLSSPRPSLMFTETDQADKSKAIRVSNGDWQFGKLLDDATTYTNLLYYTDSTEEWTIPDPFQLRLLAQGDVTPSSTNHAFQIGPNAGQNLRMDANEIASLNAGGVSPLYLNNEGGDVWMVAQKFVFQTSGAFYTPGATGGGIGPGSINVSDNYYINGQPITQALKEVGEIFWFSGSTPPNGSVLANGQELSRTTYATLNSLYSADGYPHGSGNGTTTFNVPDLRGRSPIGIGTGDATYATAWVLGGKGGDEKVVLIEINLPPHTHSVPEGGTTLAGVGYRSGGSQVSTAGQTTGAGNGTSEPVSITSPVYGLTPCVFTGVFS